MACCTRNIFSNLPPVTVEVEIRVRRREAERLLSLLRRQRVSVFYARVPAQFGTVDGDA
jgi:hypothetical protein